MDPQLVRSDLLACRHIKLENGLQFVYVLTHRRVISLILAKGASYSCEFDPKSHGYYLTTVWLRCLWQKRNDDAWTLGELNGA